MVTTKKKILKSSTKISECFDNNRVSHTSCTTIIRKLMPMTESAPVITELDEYSLLAFMDQFTLEQVGIVIEAFAQTNGDLHNIYDDIEKTVIDKQEPVAPLRPTIDDSEKLILEKFVNKLSLNKWEEILQLFYLKRFLLIAQELEAEG